jgi:2-alkyl-3-oxoalkanoate reductase
MPMQLAITGATGTLGHHAAEEVVAAGHELTVVHRASTSLDRLKPLGFRAAVADLNDRESLHRALASVDAAINCAGYYVIAGCSVA